MRPSTRLRVTVAALLCVSLIGGAMSASAAAPPAQDGVFETWVVHLTGDSGSDQGRVWLRETPCRQGFFFMLTAPRAAAEADHAVVLVGGAPLVTIPAERLGFAIVLDEWPATGFGDPSPAYVGWGEGDPAPEAVYEALRAGDVEIVVCDAWDAPLLSGVTR